jgi:hypothetical protein
MPIFRTIIAILTIAFTSNSIGQEVIISAFSQAPSLDGQGSEWSKIPQSTIKLKPTLVNSKLEIRDLLIKAGHYKEQVYFYLKWPDLSEDIIHKPYVWNKRKQRYNRGSEREDRLAMQFEISGHYLSDWTNADEFVADMWHWKASRTNPLMLAHDKKTTLSRNKLLRAASLLSADGRKRYVLRENDEGSPIYRSLRYGNKEQDVMPKYQLLDNPLGSIADVKARGKWQDGHWHLVLSRKFNTGYNDDVRFMLKQVVRGGIAVFDSSENNDHLISETLLFQF